jgi:hypothetical protein
MPQPKPKPKRRPRQKPAARLFRFPALDHAYGTLLVLLTLLITARLLAAAFAAVPPVANVGDRLVLSQAWPGLRQSIVVPAHEMTNAFAAPGKACRLETVRMAREGGVLTVMAVRPHGVVLSWAGGRTAQDADCGAASGEVMISKNDYVTLLRPPTPKH